MDVEKTIQFLLEQQAKFDARQAQSAESMAQIRSMLLDVASAQQNTNAILTTLTERHIALAQSHEALFQAQRITERSLSALAQSHEALSQIQAVTEQRLSELAQSQKVTEQSLQSLSATVERHIASHR